MAYEYLRQALLNEYLRRQQFERQRPLFDAQVEREQLENIGLKTRIRLEQERQEALQGLSEVFSDTVLPVEKFKNKYNVPEDEFSRIKKLESEGKEREANVLKLRTALINKPDVLSKLYENESLRPIVESAFPAFFRDKQSRVHPQSLGLLDNRLKEIEEMTKAEIKVLRERERQKRLTEEEKNKLKKQRDFYRATLDFAINLQKGNLRQAIEAYKAQLDVWKESIKSQIMTPLEMEQFFLNLEDSLDAMISYFDNQGLFSGDSELKKAIEGEIEQIRRSRNPEEAIEKFKGMLDRFSTIKSVPAPPQPSNRAISGEEPAMDGGFFSKTLKQAMEFIRNPGQKIDEAVSGEEKKKKEVRGKIVSKGGKAIFKTNDGVEIDLEITIKQAKEMDSKELQNLIKEKLRGK